MGKYEDNLELFYKAVRCEPVERIPVIPCASAYYARQGKVRMKDYINDYDLACEVNLKEHLRIEADGTQNLLFSPYILGTQWLSKTAIPGISAGDDDVWQVLESENMQFEDYEEIKKIGWNAFQAKFIAEKCDNNWANLAGFVEANPRCVAKFAEAGIPCLVTTALITPFEYFCGARSMETFFAEDLMEEPELMHEIFDLVLKENLQTYRTQLAQMKPVGVWIGGWRTSPGMISPPLFEEFVWPSFRAYYDLCMEMGVVPIFHLDSDWELGLPYFKELQEGTYVLALDSKTDIRKTRAVLGPKVCIMGDVPCELLSFGTPEEVEHYVNSVLEDIGPWGCIVASGCDIPPDAKAENVLAMSRTAHDFLKTHEVK